MKIYKFTTSVLYVIRKLKQIRLNWMKNLLAPLFTAAHFISTEIFCISASSLLKISVPHWQDMCHYSPSDKITVPLHNGLQSDGSSSRLTTRDRCVRARKWLSVCRSDRCFDWVMSKVWLKDAEVEEFSVPGWFSHVLNGFIKDGRRIRSEEYRNIGLLMRKEGKS